MAALPLFRHSAGRVDGHVRPRLVDHQHDAERDADLLAPRGRSGGASSAVTSPTGSGSAATSRERARRCRRAAPRRARAGRGRRRSARPSRAAARSLAFAARIARARGPIASAAARSASSFARVSARARARARRRARAAASARISAARRLALAAASWHLGSLPAGLETTRSFRWTISSRYLYPSARSISLVFRPGDAAHLVRAVAGEPARERAAASTAMSTGSPTPNCPCDRRARPRGAGLGPCSTSARRAPASTRMTPFPRAAAASQPLRRAEPLRRRARRRCRPARRRAAPRARAGGGRRGARSRRPARRAGARPSPWWPSRPTLRSLPAPPAIRSTSAVTRGTSRDERRARLRAAPGRRAPPRR